MKARNHKNAVSLDRKEQRIGKDIQARAAKSFMKSRKLTRIFPDALYHAIDFRPETAS
jgi:hypothetical protein